jgi:hypothetical protein
MSYNPSLQTNGITAKADSSVLTPKVLRGQILVFAIFGHVAVIRCDMIFWEFYSI